MKRESKYFIAGLLIVLAVGCKKDFLDVNVNPNNPTVTTPSLVFTNAVNVYISNTGVHTLGEFYAGHYSQSSSFIGGQPSQTYALSNTDFNFFGPGYNNLNDFQYIINNTTEATQHLSGYSRVMKALIFQRLVDLYGDVPYTDALKGTATLLPKYDDDMFIYEDLIKVLDTAITDIKTSTVESESADIVFAGDKTSWIQFANTLKLRLLMHQAFINGREGYITSEINKIIAEGTGFIEEGTDVTANPGYISGSLGKINPYFIGYGYDQNFAQAQGTRLIKLSNVVIETLKNTADTFRLKREAYPAGGPVDEPNAADFVGIPFGAQNNTYLESLTSSVGPVQVDVFTDANGLVIGGNQTADVFIMTAAESFLLQAEAKQLYDAGVNLPLTAQEYYEQGVRESFRAVGADEDAEATELLTGGKANADWTASTNKLTAIYTQKWLALLNIDGLEAWTEQRRTEVPDIPLSEAAAVPNQPVRLFYPLVEETSNGANVPDGITLDTKIFWDVN